MTSRSAARTEVRGRLGWGAVWSTRRADHLLPRQLDVREARIFREPQQVIERRERVSGVGGNRQQRVTPSPTRVFEPISSGHEGTKARIENGELKTENQE